MEFIKYFFRDTTDEVHTITTMEYYSPMVLAIVTIIIIIIFQNSIRNWKHESKFRISLGVLLLILEFGTYIRHLLRGTLSINTLPLHLCSLSIIFSVFLLVSKKTPFHRNLFEIVFYWAFIGGFVTFVFPNLSVGFNHYNYYRFMGVHYLIIFTSVYFLTIHQYHINYKSYIKSFVSLLIAASIALKVNLLYGTHYMYLLPNNEENLYSFIPELGKWPINIGTGILLSLTLYTITHFLSKLINVKKNVIN